MPERQITAATMSPPTGTSGWDPWAPELNEPPPPTTHLQWLGLLSIGMWACATLLALQYL